MDRPIVDPFEQDAQQFSRAFDAFAEAAALGFTPQAKLSVQADVIARALFCCACIQAGKGTAPEWRELSIALQQRYRYLAERAIGTIDPKVRLNLQEEAAEATANWMDGPYLGDSPTTYEIAKYALGEYEALLAGVKAEVEQS